ncbi:MAG: response regulator transcription factor [Deltaproteobacteria bacterium]|jgi:two-component system phosphate regulon response regulator PhoB|nr:response regulator transcription factor [Deltaproteobacteria bacterium]
MMFELCVISSSPTLGDDLGEAFHDDNISIAAVTSGSAALKRACCGCSAAILLDEDPPDMTAAELLRHLSNDERGRDALAVVLSARSNEIDRVIAFELGADDFIPKPIGIRELRLRVKAVLRRHSDERESLELMRVGPFAIDTRDETVTCEGEPVRLTAVEFRLLEHLARNTGQVQDRRELLARVWKWCDVGGDRGAVSRTVDTHVKRLREKLGPASHLIETIRGVGYRLREAS